MTNLDPEVRYLSYFRDIRERRSWMARTTVLVAVFGMLGLNMYLMFLSTDAVVLNVDQVRLEQSDQYDEIQTKLGELEARIDALESEVDPTVVEAR